MTDKLDNLTYDEARAFITFKVGLERIIDAAHDMYEAVADDEELSITTRDQMEAIACQAAYFKKDVERLHDMMVLDKTLESVKAQLIDPKVIDKFRNGDNDLWF